MQPKASHLRRKKAWLPMQCSVMLNPSFGPSDQYTMCEDCCKKRGDDRGKSVGTEQVLLDTVYAEEVITSAEDYVLSVKKWQERRTELGVSFLILQCSLLGREAQILRQKLSFKRNTSIHIVYSDAYGVNLEASSFRETWKTEMRHKVKTVCGPTAVFGGMRSCCSNVLDELTMEDLLVMYVPSIFAEFYAHSLSALLNSLHTFTPFLDRKSTSRVVAPAPAPACCLENAVTHSQRKRRSQRDQALYDSANLVATQLYHGVASHFGPQVALELERRGSRVDAALRIGLEDATVPFHNLYVARGGEVDFRRGVADGFEIVCWTCYGSPEGGEFVIPGLLYKFVTGQGSTVMFRPNRIYHATLSPENRDSVNEKFAVALIS